MASTPETLTSNHPGPNRPGPSRPAPSAGVRLRRRLTRSLPLLVWLLAIAVTGALLRLEPTALPYPGETRVLRLPIIAPSLGTVEKVLVQDQQVVVKGQILARLFTKPDLRWNIIAPQAGRLERVRCHEGQVLLAGQQVATLATPKPRSMVAYVPEAEAVRLAPGMRAEVQLVAGLSPQGKLLSSRILSLGLSTEDVPKHLLTDPNRSVRARPVFLQIPDNWDEKRLPGQSLRVRFVGD